jgi:hypothetical protein
VELWRFTGLVQGVDTVVLDVGLVVAITSLIAFRVSMRKGRQMTSSRLKPSM